MSRALLFASLPVTFGAPVVAHVLLGGGSRLAPLLVPLLLLPFAMVALTRRPACRGSFFITRYWQVRFWSSRCQTCAEELGAELPTPRD